MEFVTLLILGVLLLQSNFGSCAVAQVKIVGGANATEGEFPFLVSLQMKPSFGSRYHYCGGAILNASHVITAGNCVEGRVLTQIEVLAGAHTLQVGVDDGPLQQRRAVTSYTAHPQFDSETLSNDIALLRLNQSLDFTARVQPITLATPTTVFTGNCSIAGWGSNLTPGGPSAEPQFLENVNMTLVSQQSCRSIYEYIRPFEDSMLCAKGTRDDKTQGPCSGDSGSPLVCTEASNNASVLAGVLSWSMIPCGNSGYPSVYTNITILQDFL